MNINYLVWPRARPGRSRVYSKFILFSCRVTDITTPNFMAYFRDIAPCVSATRVAAISQPAGVCDMITRDPVPGWQLSASAVISPTHGSCLSLATLPPFLFLRRPLFLGTKLLKHPLSHFKYFILSIFLLNLDQFFHTVAQCGQKATR